MFKEQLNELAFLQTAQDVIMSVDISDLPHEGAVTNTNGLVCCFIALLPALLTQLRAAYEAAYEILPSLVSQMGLRGGQC